MTRTFILIVLSATFLLVPNAFVQANQQSAGTTSSLNKSTGDLAFFPIAQYFENGKLKSAGTPVKTKLKSAGTPVKTKQKSVGTPFSPKVIGTELSTKIAPEKNVTLLNPLGAGTDLPTLLTDILQLVVRVGTVVVILMLVYIGFLFVTAQGEPTKIQQARSALLWTIVGALLLLGAEAIAQGISATVAALSTGN